ncbi:MAG: DegV family protein [Candidatus Heimdallarchaeota archaeon]|nr:MAG: DegV family protein [Candidatus Heimdallarchaeota archaeon]
MNKVSIVTDGSADLPREIVEKYNIQIAPFQVIFGDKIYQMMGNFGDLTPDEFYGKLATAKDYPTTSVPTPQSFVTAFENADKKAKSIIGIFISKELSGTYQSALRVVQMNDSMDITLVDSKASTSTLGVLVVEAAKMAKAGSSKEEILARLDEFIPKAKLVCVLDSIDSVYRSGRAGWGKKFMVNAFKIKPLIQFEDGKLVPGGTIRGREVADNALRFTASQVVKHAINDLIFVWHVRRPDFANELKEIMEKNNPEGKEIIVIEAGPVVGTHVGAGALAFMYVGDYNNNWLLKQRD